MFSELQRQIGWAVQNGAGLDEIETEIIDAAPIDEEQRSALWLYAEALQERRSDATLDEHALA